MRGIKSQATKRKSTEGIKKAFVQTQVLVAPLVGLRFVARLLMSGGRRLTRIYYFQA